MRSFRIISLLLLFMVMTTNSGFADSKLPERAVGQPVIFTDEASSSEWAGISANRQWGRLGTQPWAVYIDRDGVKSYEEPSSSSKVKEKSLEFLSKYLVAKVSGDYALLYYEKYGQEDLMISKNAKSIGWVCVDELLLWSTCPRTSNQVSQKAVIVKDIDYIQNKKDINEASPLFMQGPSGTKSAEYRAVELEFYYVYKYVDGAALMFVESKIQENTNITTIKGGWMPRGNYTRWDVRLCYEPEFGEEVENQEVAVFGEKAEAREYKNYGKISENALWRGSNPLERWSPKKVRFPVIDMDDSYIAEVATISSFGDNRDGNTKEQQRVLDEAREKLDMLQAKMRTVNVVFVLDGTSSMKNYFKPMAEAVRLAMSQNVMQGKNISFGAVVYRNYGDGDKVVEYKNLTKDYQSVINWILTRKVESEASSHHEALYYGLETATDKMSWEKDNSNFLILVGDAGNPEKDSKGKTLSGVARKLADKEVNFIAYQANHPDNIAYHDFVSQTQRLMNEELRLLLGRPIKRSDYNQQGHLYSVEAMKNGVLKISAGYHYAEVNTSESPSGLKSLIEEKIVDFTAQAESDIRELQISLQGDSGGETAGQFGEELRNLLRDKGFDDDAIKALEEANLVLKVKGYTSRVAGENDAFTSCVFFAKDELQDLMRSLEKVTKGVSSNRRKDLYHAMMQLALSYLGQQGEEVSADELMEAIRGVGKGAGTPILGGIKIKDILNVQRVPDSMINDFINQMEKGVQKLKKLEIDKSCYFVSPNGLWYYYILLEDMPLMD